MSTLDVGSFTVIAETIREACGITVTQEKMYLVETRMQAVLRRYNFGRFSDLAHALREAKSRGTQIILKPNQLMYDVVEAMTINETSFFRDSKPFNFLRSNILPEFRDSGPMRIWSAACSTGQEPYSILITAQEAKATGVGGAVDVVATDISNSTVEKARRGEYSQFEVQRGMPIQMLVKYFRQDNDRWIVRDELKNMVSFELVNLTNDFSRLGRFEVIFCRNVLIYFEQDTKADIMKRIHQLIKPGGYLILGGSETNYGVESLFECVEGYSGIFRIK